MTDNFFMKRTIRQTSKIGNSLSGTGQLYQYMSSATKAHVAEMARYASDFFAAQVEGLDANDPTAINWYRIRASENFSALNMSNTSKNDDWRVVYFERSDIDYIQPGTKFWFWNNTWLADNPSNIASVTGNALVKRCNAVWNALDYYGNIVSEPMAITKPTTTANANTDTEMMNLADSYIDCIMQANEWTLANLRNNTRMILGTSGFAVRGLSDYIREFTDVQDSVRILRFSLYYQEPLEIDDMENQVAGGLAFSWQITISGPQSMQAGKSAIFTADSLRNNELVPSTQPVTYQWTSSNLEVATVDETTGVVTTIADGETTIICTLAENTNISSSVLLTVQAATSGLTWAFVAPENVPAYQSRDVVVEGAQGPISWSFSGPEQNCYSVTTNGGKATIMCFYPSPIPLTVTVTDSVTTLTAEIQLTGR